jgi:hypothetical protein
MEGFVEIGRSLIVLIIGMADGPTHAQLFFNDVSGDPWFESRTRIFSVVR